MTLIAELEQFFFEAMRTGGWISSSQRYVPSRFPCERIIEVVGDRFLLRDTWLSVPGKDSSAGTTIISHQGVPLWVMQYAGSYPEEALPVVKAALSAAYGSRVFHGGRGLHGTEVNHLVYTNDAADRITKFSGFEGQERVIDTRGRVVGFHNYSGMLL